LQIPGIGLRKRIFLLFLFTFVATVVLIGRLAYIQLVRGEEYRQGALDVRVREITVEAKRGNILDREGRELAISVNADSVFAIPAQIENPEETARIVSDILELSYDYVYDRITKNLSFSWIQRKGDQAKTSQLREANLPGIYFTQESRRVYPKNELASHVLGFAGIDSQGLEGIEVVYDEQLKGEPGRIVIEFDAYGREIPQALQYYVPPTDGLTLVLTIDEVIQYVVERELDRIMVEHQAKSAMGIVMDPKTGEILAMANRPAFDPNKPLEYGPETWRNPIVSNSYAPGSIFKPITTAAAFEEGVVNANTHFWDPGNVTVLGHTIRNWNGRGLGDTTFTEAFQQSANVVFVKTGLALGIDRFYEYLEKFGFMEKTGIDLPGEGRAIYPAQDRATDLDLAVMSFGQTLAVTPLQMITAIAAIANDGYLMQPYIAKEFRDADGQVVESFEPTVKRQVVSEETAREVLHLMQLTVDEGTGARAQIEGYNVGGKTGTAEKVENGRLVEGRYMSAFMGVVPIEDPQLVVYILVDEPEGIYYGSWVAAPAAGNIMRDSLRYLGIPPSYDPNEKEVIKDREVPSIINLTVSEADRVLRNNGLRMTVIGDGERIVRQVPAAGASVASYTEVLVYTETEETLSTDRLTVPDLSGKSIREVANILGSMGLSLEPTGSGVAAEQEPKAGQKISTGGTVRVKFETPETGR